jgi:hypothetical protein
VPLIDLAGERGILPVPNDHNRSGRPSDHRQASNPGAAEKAG